MPEYKAPNINTIMLTGNVVENPDLRYLPDGKAVLTFRIAHNSSYRNKDGEWVEAPPVFMKVVMFGSGAEWLGENLQRGHTVCIDGKLQGREWTDKNTGDKRNSVEIHATRVQKLTKSESETEAEEPNE
jgi:single-strand DNA-binding protein